MITNLTKGTYTSRKMKWDGEFPFVKGNYISSFYSSCESSEVPIQFTCENHTYIVGKWCVYRTALCESRDEIITKMAEGEGWECRRLYNDDLKTIVSQENWEYLGTKSTFVVKEGNIEKVEVLNFDRSITWHFGVLPVCSYREEQILLTESKFVFTEKNAYFRKNNDEYYKIFDHTVETFEYQEKVYRVVGFKGRFCLFTKIEEKYYGYEFHNELGLPEALEYIEKKAKYDRINSISLEEAIDWLVQSQVELTINDSYAVGNCKPGTKAFLERYFQGKESLFINSENKLFILRLAQGHKMFSNVLRKKYADKF